MEIVTAKIAHKEITNGVTKPYIITCDNSEQYVVKFKENPEGKRILANEYVCAKIAEILELPLASPSLVQVNEEFIEDFGEQISKHTEEDVTVGLHFGTKRIKKAFQISSAGMLELAKNIECIPGIILFDQLVCNCDRECNGGNLLFDQSKMEIVVLDHTHAFDIGPLWDEHNLNFKIGEAFKPLQPDGYVYRKLIPHVKGHNPFNSILEKMERLDDNSLWNIINNIPEEWGVTGAQKEKLLEYIGDRLNRIETALPVLKPGLPYWKGGS
ncbi:MULTISPECIES: HipA family kinase [Bacillus cereus group]|uniref:HipA family kinase n=1 Tax=Bacillus cereus group TaxID=86661 RepID=UPI000BFD6793|nr:MULTISPECIES: HipA family kinase [Bacillus cereus group]PGR23697.1 hypothetical protein COC50_14690 [Bacillus anthracis]MDA1987406.1 hypothetical protein [Bacillus cereus group sp. BcHK104]MDK7473879.1 hypothetical protein [Bacillus paranthracis]MEC3527279.1 hypothetical protein [Bacillus paranthracis]QCU09742.1 hypothetical protein BCPR1_08255 [Bacillus paranthracis]